MAIPLGRPLRILNNQHESLNINTRIAGGRITQQIKEPKVNDILYFGALLNDFPNLLHFP
jgi:hypothetical protein